MLLYPEVEWISCTVPPAKPHIMSGDVWYVQLRMLVRIIVCCTGVLLSICGIVSSCGPRNPEVYIGLW